MNESTDILEGFNAGYIIRQSRPELFKQLEESFKDVDLPFFNSFSEGGKELSKDRFKSLFQNKGMNRDQSMDIAEPDIDLS